MMKKLVVGAHGFAAVASDYSVTSARWDQLRRISNLADFDRIIVAIESFPTPDHLDINALQDVFWHDNIARVLLNNGHIVIVGDPRKTIDSETVKSSSRRSTRSWPRQFLDLFSLGVQIDGAGGSNTTFPSYPELPRSLQSYLHYVRCVNSWTYSYSCIDPDFALYESRNPYNLNPGPNVTGSFRIRRTALALTRYSTRVSEALTFIVEYFGQYPRVDQLGNPVATEALELGSLVLLPALHESLGDPIVVLLREVFGVETHTPRPLWIEELVAPGQPEVDERIQETEQQISMQQIALQNLHQQREERRKPLRLLYAMGNELEDAALEALEALGATRLTLDSANRADSLLAVEPCGETQYLAVEVKGTTRESFDTKGLRQLNEWKMEIAEERGIDAKGLLIGNAAIASEPSTRQNPFGHQLQQTAKIQRHAMIKSETLFRCFERHVSHELNIRHFWNVVLNEVGELTYEMLTDSNTR